MATRFNAKETTVRNELKNVLKRMNATNLRIEEGNLLDDKDNKAKIIFDRGAKRYVFECNTYKNKLDNLRAAQLAISYLYRALEAYGVSQSSTTYERIMDNFLLGFEATPEDDVLKLPQSNEWYDILGVRPDATVHDIKQAYKSLAKVHHPDYGGDAHTFKKIKEAYEKGVGER